MAKSFSDADLLAMYAAPRSGAVEELARFARLPEEKRKTVLERLRAIHLFEALRSHGSADANATAADLGLTTRSLYRLVARVREMGAVAALAPTANAGRKRRCDAGNALSPAVVDLIQSQAIHFPLQSGGALLAKVHEIDPAAAASTVRRFALQARRLADPISNTRFGGRWLLDQAALRIPVLRGGETFWTVATFLVDIDTGLIAGRALVRNEGDPGFEVLLDAIRRSVRLPASRLKFASRASEILWAPPPGMATKADEVAAVGRKRRPAIKVDVLAGSKFRRGVELSKLKGGMIGGAEILIRATADPKATIGKNDPPVTDDDGALASLDRHVSFENSSFSKWAAPRPSGEPASKSRIEAIRRIYSDLMGVFAPVLSTDQLDEAEALIGRIGQPSEMGSKRAVIDAGSGRG